VFKPVSEVVSIFSWVVASIQVSAALCVQAGVVVDFGIVCLIRCLKVSIFSGVVTSIQVSAALCVQADVVIDSGIACLRQCLKASLSIRGFLCLSRS
jgi:hypothetical protein